MFNRRRSVSCKSDNIGDIEDSDKDLNEQYWINLFGAQYLVLNNLISGNFSIFSNIFSNLKTQIHLEVRSAARVLVWVVMDVGDIEGLSDMFGPSSALYIIYQI